MHKALSLLSLSILLFFQTFILAAQSPTEKQPPAFLSNLSEDWVDSVFKTLSQEEKIAQLMMIRVLSNKDARYADSLSAAIKKYKVGGMIFFQGGPVRQAHLNNRFQSESKVPMLVAIDGEWGLGMRLDSTISFPYQMPLGAIQEDSLIYEMGRAIAGQCKRIGIHVNFAPVVDVNNNPNNPIINYRSFGENKFNVARKSYWYMKGLQDNGVLATAKHFPGHGDTDVDSHQALPIINHDKARLDTLELYPFKYLMERGLGGMMVAHLSIPKLDSTKNLPSTLSKPIVTGLLREELGFQGLVFTDALDMKGVTKYFSSGELDVRAILAGNDVLELSEDVAAAIEAVKKAVRNGRIRQAEIDLKCRKILAAKYWAGLNNYKPIEVKNLVEDLNNPHDQLLNRKLIEASLTLIKNEGNVLPFRRLDSIRISALALNVGQQPPFQSMLQNYTKVNCFNLGPNPTEAMIEVVRRGIEGSDIVVVSVHKQGRPNKVRLDTASYAFCEELLKGGKTILTLFTNPYSLGFYHSANNARAILLGYQDTPVTEELAAQQLFGAVGVNAKLPISATSAFKLNLGLIAAPLGRLKYTMPLEAQLDTEKLAIIDSLAEKAINEKATPGCQIMAVRDGNVVFRKSYGYHNYENKRKVLDTDLYDLASVTKVVGSLAALMKLYDEGKFNVDGKLGDYLQEFKGSNKSDLTFREILSHQAGLKAWIPFWENTLKKKYRKSNELKASPNRKFKWATFKSDSSKRFPFKVAENLYLHRKYYRKVFKEIKKSPLSMEKKYVYSDLSFYLYPQIVEKITGRKFEDYLKEEFYRPMGAYSFTFNPEPNHPLEAIVPTEYDSLFRKSLIHGRVHDEGAAMLDGVSGHAGLFGNANDLAKIMQMYLNQGQYGGKQYIKASTLAEFTKCQFCEQNNRRALGFDRPVSPPSDNGNAAKSASQRSFGHTGFTGIFAWADPETKIVYVFLSNRVHLTRNNSRIFKLNTRTNIQEAIYQAIIK